MTNTDDLIARLEYLVSLPNSQRSDDHVDDAMLEAADFLTALQDRVTELEGALRDFAEHEALQDREYLSADLNAKLDRARAFLAKGEKG